MDPVSLALRLLHILPAVFLAGGIFFMWSSLHPGLASVDDTTRKSVDAAVRSKWAKIVMICSALLLVSGLINAVRNIMAFEYATPYHLFVTAKLVLAFAIMFITARLGGRSQSAEKFREKAGTWLSVNALLVVILIVIASTMRVSDKTPKPPKDIESAAIQQVDAKV